MGKGDKKTKRGKIIMGSFGVRRPKRKKDISIVKDESLIAKVKAEKPKKEEAPKEKKKPATKKAVVENQEEPIAVAPKKKATKKTAKAESKGSNEEKKEGE
jgi:ribosomal small subunit protein bTHX